MGNCQRRGRGEIFQRFAPELFRLAQILFLQPPDEIAEVARRRKLQIFTATERFVKCENFVQQVDDGAAIEQQVMKCPSELPFGFAGAKERKAQERRLGQVESSLALGGKPVFKQIFLRGLCNGTPILLPEFHLDAAMHLLQRFIVSAPVKTCPQYRVAFDHAPPCPPEGPGIHGFMQYAKDLLHVHARFARGQVVEQHPLLHRRKRIRACCRVRFHLAISNMIQR